jgi:DNA-binding NtrC family response regulator
LVVEDDDQVRAIACAILRSSGYHVLCAANAARALAISAECAGPIDLLLTDVLLPSMTGRQLAKRLSEGRPRLQVMYISGYPADVLAEKGWLDDSAVLLEKPFRMEEMLGQVRRMIGSRTTG